MWFEDRPTFIYSVEVLSSLSQMNRVVALGYDLRHIPLLRGRAPRLIQCASCRKTYCYNYFEPHIGFELIDLPGGRT